MAANQRDKGKRGALQNNDPADEITPVTASDTVDIYAEGTPCRGLLVGTAGAADLIDSTGVARAAVPLQQGYNPLRVTRVKATNLTASNIWALR